MSIIKASGLTVDRGGFTVVKDVAVNLFEGSWLGVIGANGSGKTSLLRALAGRLPISGGSVVIDGIETGADRAARAALIGFAPDAATLPDALTGQQLFNIISGGGCDLGADDVLRPLRDALGLKAIAGRPLGSCSAGMRQRVAIYCAFASGLRIVMLDEPFNWLDPLAAYDTRIALRALVDHGYALVTALHDIGTLASACQAGAMMRDGRIVLSLDADDLGNARRDPVAFEASTIDHLRRASATA